MAKGSREGRARKAEEKEEKKDIEKGYLVCQTVVVAVSFHQEIKILDGSSAFRHPSRSRSSAQQFRKLSSPLREVPGGTPGSLTH